MQLKDIMRELSLTRLNPMAGQENTLEATAGHASDLLSDVLANAPGGSVLITIQVHMNVIAVSLHAGVAAVIFTSGLCPEKAVVDKATEEALPLYSSQETTFDIVGRLYSLGLRGDKGRELPRLGSI